VLEDRANAAADAAQLLTTLIREEEAPA